MSRDFGVFFKKNLTMLLLCAFPCSTMMGCLLVNLDKLDDELENEYFYERRRTYETLIRACRERIVPEERRASLDIRKVTYKELNEYRRAFCLKYHPDKGGQREYFVEGNEAWEALEEKLLKEDQYAVKNLKKEVRALLDYVLQTDPVPGNCTPCAQNEG